MIGVNLAMQVVWIWWHCIDLSKSYWADKQGAVISQSTKWHFSSRLRFSYSVSHFCTPRYLIGVNEATLDWLLQMSWVCKRHIMQYTHQSVLNDLEYPYSISLFPHTWYIYGAGLVEAGWFIREVLGRHGITDMTWPDRHIWRQCPYNRRAVRSQLVWWS